MQKTIFALFLSLSLLAVSTAFAPAQDSTPPLSLTLILLGFCCIITLIIGVAILGFVARRGDQEGKKES